MDSITAVLPNELALVTRAVVEPAAFAAVYDHYFPRVYNYVRYRVRDIGTADDFFVPAHWTTYVGSTICTACRLKCYPGG